MVLNPNHHASATSADPSTESKAVFDFAREHLTPTIVKLPPTSDEIPFAVVPRGQQITSIKSLLDEYRTAPERRTGSVTVSDLESFVAHAKRFADADSVLFADESLTAPRLVAIHNYHRSGPEGTGALARFGDHRTIYPFPLSPEWVEWSGAEKGGAIDQREFVEFLEDRVVDVLPVTSIGENAAELCRTLGIVVASPEKLVELASSLSLRVDSKVKSTLNLSTGEREIVFEESHSAGDYQKVKIPTGFVLAIPVFRGGHLYQLPVRLRYRLAGSSVRWIVQIARAESAFRDAFREACEEARTKTGLPLFYGTPDR